jgi:hypothetical protein
MKVQITSGIQWDNKHCEPGDVIDVKDADAAWLIGRAKAKKYVEQSAQPIPTAPVDEPIIDRSVGLETSSEPKLTKRRSWKKQDQ